MQKDGDKVPIIQIDTRQQMKRKHHQIKEKYFTDSGWTVVHSKLIVGDYALPSNMAVSVDTKKDCSELYQDLIQDHARFHNECVLAKECGIQLIILVENKEGFKKPEDILQWKNPQYFRYKKACRIAKANGKKPPRPPASNVQLLKIMHSMSRDYGVRFEFCSTQEAGPRIIELLTGGGEDT